MAEHAWVLENAASYLANGLDPAELERFDRHVASCPECADAVQQVRSFDDTMQGLFVDAQPDPALEDRMIGLLRASARPRRRTLLRYRKLALSTAAVVLLGAFGVLGAFIIDTVEQGGLPFPGMSGNEQARLAVNSTPSLRTSGESRDDSIVSYNEESRVVVQNADSLASRTREFAVAGVDELSYLVAGGDADGHSPDGSEITATETTFWDKGESSRTSRSGDVSGLVEEGRWGYRSTVSPSASPELGQEGQGGRTYEGQSSAIFADVPPGDAGVALTVKTSPVVEFYTFVNDLPTASTVVSGAAATTGTTVAAVQPHFKPSVLASDWETTQVVPTGESALPGFYTAQVKQVPGRVLVSQAETAAGQQPEQPRQVEPAALAQRKIIRSGDMEFEVDSFDATVEKITKIANEESGYIATVDSEQLSNGKMQGSVVIRVPPERLDTLVLKLRALGELKNQKIGSQDVTKKYTDLESRLRAARAMEVRLLEIIKNGKGEIEHLLKAEKELGVWRTKIEETEGELRFYKNVIAMSTLTIKLAEKEIRAAATLTETERVQMGIEVEDVEQSHREALKAIGEADGLITKSELKQHEAEQYSAVINFEIERDAAGPLRDRLRQIGRVARLDIDRVQQAEGGSGLPRDARTVRKDTQFSVSLYNVANVAPRETMHINLACMDTEASYKSILKQVKEAGGRIVTSSIKKQHSQKTTGSLQFELPIALADEALANVKATGEVMRLELTENPDSKNVTKSKRGFKVELWAMGLVAPRETIVLKIATDDVPAGYRMLQEAVRNANGRILNAQLNEQDRQNITAQLDFDVPRHDQPALDMLGEVVSRNLTRSQDDDNVIDSKVLLRIELIDQARIAPRETFTLGIEVKDVDQAAAQLSALVAESKGRVVESHLAHERSGRVTAKVVFHVPLASASGLVQDFKKYGTVRAQQSTRNIQVPDGKLSIARLDVTLSNVELIVPSDGGLLARIRTGLSTSFAAISWSLVVIIVGLCFVLPWVLAIYVAYRIIALFRRKTSQSQTTS